MDEINELIQQRIKKLDKLRKEGVNPFSNDFKATHTSLDLRNRFGSLSDQDLASVEEKFRLAGRIMAIRDFGKASFLQIQDRKGRIQAYLRRDIVGDRAFRLSKEFDIGDYVGLEGKLFRTKTRELTLEVEKVQLLTKSLRPLPEKWHGLTDVETRYRQRYVDLIVNPNVKEIFLARIKTIQLIRDFFLRRDFVEVETPMMHPIPGGATARPFKTHHNALDIPLYLRIANELYLKRLIVGGYEGVYEFAKDFRNEGMDRTHNPEFTVMEIYIAYKDYNWMMKFTEEIIEKVALDLHGTTEITYGDKVINLKPPYRRVPMLDLIKETTGYDIYGMDEESLRKVCDSLGVEHDPTMGKGKLIDAIFSEKCEHLLVQPTFVIDYPVETSPLTKMHRSKPGLTERFELFINCKEIANAYSELNDPIDQMERFREQLRLSEKGDNEAMFIDHDFVRALEYGMPPTSGMGIGIDRLTMLMTNQPSIQDVLFFPQMKPLVPKPRPESPKEDFLKLGVPEEWIDPLKKLGYLTVNMLKEVEKPSRLANELNIYNKKNKLGLAGLNPETVEKWIR